jgi:apolipoprotein N-acyltransferase
LSASVEKYQMRMESPLKNNFLFLISFMIVAFGQPAWSAFLCPLSATIGYALFWTSLSRYDVKRTLLAACVWFTAVQLIWLSWMTSIEYQGLAFLIFYLLISLCLAIQFALLTFFVMGRQPLTYLRIAGLAGFWVILEWSRLYFLCGFSWNPVGLSLAAFTFPMQLAALGGIFLLSFWVMMTNLLAYKINPKRAFVFLFAALFPYLFGFFSLHFNREDSTDSLRVALLQTQLLPDQKTAPFERWSHIAGMMKQLEWEECDLIILPEGSVPYGSTRPVYPYEKVKEWISSEFGSEAMQHMPPLVYPFAEKRGKSLALSNAFFAQFLSNLFDSELIIGLEYEASSENSTEMTSRTGFGKNPRLNFARGEGRPIFGDKYSRPSPLVKDGMPEQPKSILEVVSVYNSALHFKPKKSDFYSYAKRVLVPIGEYLPFEWCRPLAKEFGLTQFFTPGEKNILFQGKHPFAVSICYEETFADIIREARREGAHLFVNITNDGWYPSSRLPLQHFLHGRLRAVENGVGLLRACNTGVTAVVDRFGRSIALLDSESTAVLTASFPIVCRKTLFTELGDGFIVGLSMIAFAIFTKYKGRKPYLSRF